MDYGELFTRLSYETALVAFFKKDGSVRLMLGTRNIKTAALEHGNLGGLLDGHDKRCNIKNGNLAVVDLVLGECRSFNVGRLINVHWFGEVNTQERFDEVLKEFRILKDKFDEQYKNADLDLLTNN